MAGIVAYTLGGFTLVAVLIFTVTGHAILSFQQPQTTQDNIQSNIKAWLNDFNLSETTLPDSEALPNSMFTEQVVYPDGDHQQITHLKNHTGYIICYANLTLAPEHVAIWNKLTKERIAEISQELTIEMARTQLDVAFALPNNGLHVEKRVPIVNLTEDSFISDIGQVRDGILLARSTLILELTKARPQVPPVVR